MNICVIMGGNSPERLISLRSGKAIISALENRHNITVYDPVDNFMGLKKAVTGVDIVFPILHGLNGEDGILQGLLDGLNVRYLGSGKLASQIAFDKSLFHSKVEPLGINMPKYSIVTLEDIENSIFSKPFVLKPIDGGSSIDILIEREINNSTKLKIKRLLSKSKRMLAEELVEGQEVTVAILGEHVLPIILIIPPKGGEFDYENKYNGSTKEICPVDPSIIPLNIQKSAQLIAKKSHDAIGARHLSRTDIIIRPDGKPFVLEINTMPGMTKQSLYPNAARVAGYNMESLVDEFVNLVMEN